MLAKDIFIKSRLLLLFTILLFTACAPQVVATSNPTAAPTATAVPATVAAPDQPITLQLAVSDAQGRASEPYVHEFVDQVNTLSKGNITVVPVWDAGIDMTPCCGQGVVKLVKDGQDELGLAGAGSWDTAGVTSFQALQAPFLITDDALAEAVASSEIGTQMLDSLSSAGMTGLALWPEDLRHPISMNPDQPILSPADLKGLAVRTPPSEVGYMLMKAFGGNPFFDNQTQDFPAAESGLLNVAFLNRPATITGNVVLYPKFQVLFANGAAFEKLSEGQRSILRQAAAAAQKKAIAEHPKEADAAKTYCAGGEKIVMASQEQVAAFETAAKPVLDEIQKDPLNAKLIGDIRALKANTKPAPGAEACQPAAAAPSETWSTGLPPNGKWTVNLTKEDVIAKGVSQSTAAVWAGQFVFEFQDGQGHFSGNYGDGSIAECPFTYKAVDDFFRNTYVDLGQPHYACGPEVDDLQWRLDEQGQLHLHVINLQGPPFVETKADYEAKPWQKAATSETWSTGLPPNGAWQVDLTADDVTRMGVPQSGVKDWVGVFTWTFQDDKAQLDYKGPGGDFICQANMALNNDVAKLTYFSGDACTNEVDSIKWRLDPDGLHLHLVAIQNSNFINNRAMYEAKPWQQVK